MTAEEHDLLSAQAPAQERVHWDTRKGEAMSEIPIWEQYASKGTCMDAARRGRVSLSSRGMTTLLQLALIIFAPFAVGAANPQPQTLKAWKEHVDTANAHMRERLSPEHSFLLIDEQPGGDAQLRTGEIMVSPTGPHTPKRVPSGLIHDWIGSAFIPNATLHDVLQVIRNYDRYKEIYHPAVIDSKAVSTGELEDRFSMLLMNKSLISKTGLEGDYRSSYFRVNDKRWYSVSQTVRIQQVADFGTSTQHTLSDESGSLIWRIYSITRFEERDGGVYVELEAIVLSRDIAISLRWIIDPVVRRVSRDSLLTSLRQTQEAVSSKAKLANRYAGVAKDSNTSTSMSMQASASAVRSFH